MIPRESIRHLRREQIYIPVGVSDDNNTNTSDRESATIVPSAKAAKIKKPYVLQQTLAFGIKRCQKLPIFCKNLYFSLFPTVSVYNLFIKNKIEKQEKTRIKPRFLIKLSEF